MEKKVNAKTIEDVHDSLKDQREQLERCEELTAQQQGVMAGMAEAGLTHLFKRAKSNSPYRMFRKVLSAKDEKVI